MKKQFINYLQQGAKPRSEWRVGVEIELFGFDKASKQRLDNAQVEAVLCELAKDETDLIFEENLIVGVEARGGGRWTVEPGGQIEYSGAAHRGLAAIERDLRQNLADLKQVSEKLRFVFLAVGFDPLRRIDEQNWFMKPRYKLMKPYLQTRGRKAWDMMTRTCSVQVNVDYADERDLIKKFIVGNRLAPTVAAIFANSPFTRGKVSGYKSTRVDAWNETDVDRCNISPLASADEFTLDDFVEYALDVPMLFVRKGGKYLENFTGKPFREFLTNKEFEPTLQDFQDHLTTIFTEARLKSYIELRAADCGNLQHTMTVAALWKGLLYDETALHEAFHIAPKLTAVEYCELQKAVAKNGLQAVFGRVRILDVAKEIVNLATDGLQRIAPDEVEYLDVLRQRILQEQRSPANILLEEWNDSIERIFELTAI